MRNRGARLVGVANHAAAPSEAIAGWRRLASGGGTSRSVNPPSGATGVQLVEALEGEGGDVHEGPLCAAVMNDFIVDTRCSTINFIVMDTLQTCFAQP